jgi:hypothetical protein
METIIVAIDIYQCRRFKMVAGKQEVIAFKTILCSSTSLFTYVLSLLHLNIQKYFPTLPSGRGQIPTIVHSSMQNYIFHPSGEHLAIAGGHPWLSTALRFIVLSSATGIVNPCQQPSGTTQCVTLSETTFSNEYK